MNRPLLLSRLCRTTVDTLTKRYMSSGPPQLTGMLKVQNNRENFTVLLEAPGFREDDLRAYVKGDRLVVELNYLEEGKRLLRVLTETFKLPDNAIGSTVASSHSPSSGVFTVTVDKRILPDNGWIIPNED